MLFSIPKCIWYRRTKIIFYLLLNLLNPFLDLFRFQIVFSLFVLDFFFKKFYLFLFLLE